MAPSLTIAIIVALAGCASNQSSSSSSAATVSTRIGVSTTHSPPSDPATTATGPTDRATDQSGDLGQPETAPSSVQATTSTTEPAATSAPTIAPGPALCASELSVTQINPVEGASQTDNSEIILTNSSDHECLLNGYPTISGIGTDGSSTPLNATHLEPGAIPNLQSAVSSVAPSGRAAIIVRASRACNGGVQTQTWDAIAIGLPGGGSATAKLRIDSSCGISTTTYLAANG